MTVSLREPRVQSRVRATVPKGKPPHIIKPESCPLICLWLSQGAVLNGERHPPQRQWHSLHILSRAALWWRMELFVVVVHSLNCVWLFATPWTAAHQAPLSFTISQSLLKFMSIGLMMLSNHLILCRPLLLLLSIFPSIRVFFSDSALHIRWLKYWSFSFNNFPSIEYSVLISSRVDRFDLLAVHGTFKSLLQHHTSKAWC